MRNILFCLIKNNKFPGENLRRLGWMETKADNNLYFMVSFLKILQIISWFIV